MNMKKRREAGGEESESEDQFSRLPDELLILILKKLAEADCKFLCQCLLVSKRFASTIHGMPTVSITIPYPGANAPDFEAFSHRVIDRKMQSLKLLSRQIDDASGFLKKFNKIRSLHLMFVIVGDDDDEVEDSLLNWKTKFDVDVQSFVFLFGRSIHRKAEEEENEQVEEALEIPRVEKRSRYESAINWALDLFAWRFVLLSLLLQHPTLQDITVTGPKKGGKMCLRDEHLVGLRNSLNPVDGDSGDTSGFNSSSCGYGFTYRLKSIHVPVLCLPLSGYIMKGASLVIMKAGRNSGGGVYAYSDNNDIIAWDFEAEENLFREAVTSTLMNHKDKMRFVTFC